MIGTDPYGKCVMKMHDNYNYIKKYEGEDNRPISLYLNSNLAPRLRGIKQKKYVLSFSFDFSPKPRSKGIFFFFVTFYFFAKFC